MRAGEILALVGENGAGKSTLIKILAGMHTPDAGQIRLRGAPYHPRGDSGAIPFVHQDLGLIDWMTVAENIALTQGFPRRLGLIDWPAVEVLARPGRAGHLHENRLGSFVSSELIFATYQNAGVRMFDIKDQYRPEEVAAFVPPAPERLVDHRPNRARVIQSCDVFVDAAGLVYSNDYNGGLYVLEYNPKS